MTAQQVTVKVCAEQGCSRRVVARGFCSYHHRRALKNGMPLVQPVGLPPEARFWSKVDKAGDCWLWQAQINADGYGQFSANGRKGNAHRYAYELLIGPIPEGLVIDHLCRNRACVNPAHLEAVTSLENIRRGEGDHNRRKTHCPRGHAYSPENTYIEARGGRQCRECHRIKVADRKRRLQEAAAQGIALSSRPRITDITCRSGHRRDLHTAYKPDGGRYCRECMRLAKAKARRRDKESADAR